MKTRKLLSLLGFLAIIIIASCTKEEDKPKPTAGFTASKTTVVVGEEIQFTNTTTDATEFAWSFGDGTTSDSAAPVKSYESTGTFTVTLVATGEGGTNSATQTITVIAASKASFTLSKTSVSVGELILITNTSEDAVSYAWNFGDGTTSVDVDPTKSYDAAGTFVITLIATGTGDSDTAFADVTVVAALSSEIYFMDSSDELMQKLVLNGTGAVTTVKDLAGMSGVGIAYDNVGKKIYFSDFFDADTPNGKIWRMNFDGTGIQAIVSGIYDPYGIALDVTGGKVYWTDDAGNISRANLDGTSPQIGIVNVVDGGMRAIALDPANNKMYFYEVQEEKLWVANLDGTSPSVLIDGVYGYAIYIDFMNSKLYFDDQNSGVGGELKRANLDGTGIVTVDNTETRIYGIDMDYDLGKLYWTSRDMGEIYESNLDGTGKITLATNLTSPRGMFLKK